MSVNLTVEQSVLAAMASGATLWDVYTTGFKSRPPVFCRALRHPRGEGIERRLTPQTINNLVTSGAIVLGEGDREAYGYLIPIHLTDAGRIRGEAAARAGFDVDAFFAPPKREEIDERIRRRTLRQIASGDLRIRDYYGRIAIVSVRPGRSETYEPVSLRAFQVCAAFMEKYRVAGDHCDSYRLNEAGKRYVAALLERSAKAENA